MQESVFGRTCPSDGMDSVRSVLGSLRSNMVTSWKNTVRVLAADDSLVMCGLLRELFAPGGPLARLGSPPMSICGFAHDGIDCLEAVVRLQPDLLLLDLEMPRLHGLEVLARLRSLSPALPTIMCSASTARGARTTLDGLALGAADYVAKPTMKSSREAAMDALAADLHPKIAGLASWGASRASQVLGRIGVAPVASAVPPARESIRVKAPMRKTTSWGAGFEKISRIGVVAIGVSTGGPSALEMLLPRLPANFPVPILIVQHMPKLFSTALAERLNRCCSLRVQEARDGDPVVAGTILLAPGDLHMETWPGSNGLGTVVRLREGEPADLYKPSVDSLFVSVAKRYGANALGLVMTGMGSDGLLGARSMRDAGGTILVQDQASSAVWGMPGRVAEAGLATGMLPLETMAGELVRLTMACLNKEVSQGYEATRRMPRVEMNNGLL